MAYITAATAKEIRKEIKAIFPKGWKFSITISDRSSLNIVLLSSNIDDSEHESNYINTYYLDDNKTPFGLVFKTIDEIVNKIGGWYNNSDAMTDYFDTAFYKNYSVGSWSKDYVYNAELPGYETADQYCPDVQINHGTKAGFLQLWDSLPNTPNYKTEYLSNLISVCNKIIYFSGDHEEGEARTIKQCDKDQLLRAASNQRFQIVDLHYIVRLVFDGNYIYDLYIEQNVSELLTALDIEIDDNYKQSEVAQQNFESLVNKLLH